MLSGRFPKVRTLTADLQQIPSRILDLVVRDRGGIENLREWTAASSPSQHLTISIHSGAATTSMGGNRQVLRRAKSPWRRRWQTQQEPPGTSHFLPISYTNQRKVQTEMKGKMKQTQECKPLRLISTKSLTCKHLLSKPFLSFSKMFSKKENCGSCPSRVQKPCSKTNSRCPKRGFFSL